MNKDQSFEIPTENEVRVSISYTKNRSNSVLNTESQNLPKRFSMIGMGN